MKRFPLSRLSLALAGFLCLSAGAAVAQQPDETTIFVGEDAYAEGVDNIFTHGVPKAEDLDAYKEKGVRVVFDLRAATEKPVIEEMVNKKGLIYHQITYLKGGKINAESVAAIDKLLTEFEQNNPGIKFLVHCASGNRAGSWFAIHFKSRNAEATVDEAIEAGKKMGLSAPALIKKTREYLEKAEY